MVVLDQPLALRRMRLLEGVTVVEIDLQIHYGSNAVFEQPARIRAAGSFALPDLGRLNDAEIPNRGVQIVRAGAFDRVLGEIDAPRKKQQNGADQSSHAHRRMCRRCPALALKGCDATTPQIYEFRP